MEQEKRDFKGVWIPKEIYLNNELSAMDKLIFTEINSLDRGDGCFASNSHFAEFFSIKEWAVSNSISRLKKLGFIRQSSFDGRKRFLKITLEAEWIKNTKQDCENSQSSVVKNHNHSITIENNNLDTNKENIKRKIDLSFVDESFLDDFRLWLTYKRERGQGYKGETSIRICYKKLMKLANNNFNTAREIIEQSIASNYQGLFKLKTDNGNSRNNFKTSTERLNDVYQEWYNRVFAKYETQSGVSDEVLSPEEDNLPF